MSTVKSEKPKLIAAGNAKADAKDERDAALAREAMLRELLAQRAARADEIEARVTRYNEMAGRDADELAKLRAQIAQMREALIALMPGVRHNVQSGTGHFSDEQVEAAHAALSSTTAESLEQVKREAKAEVLEDQGCTCIKPVDDGREVHADHCAIAIAAELRKGGE